MNTKKISILTKLLISSAAFLFFSCDTVLSLLNVKYEVVHYKENIYDSEFTIEETEEFTGIPSMPTTAKAKEYEGFTVKSGWKQKTILADGTASVEIYYLRNKYTISYYSEGELYSSTQYKYEAAITKPSEPTKDGYKFIGWDISVPDTMPAEDLILTAKWEKNEANPSDPEDPEIPPEEEPVDPPEEEPEIPPEEEPVDPPEENPTTASYTVTHDLPYPLKDETEVLSGKIGELTQARIKISDEYQVDETGWEQQIIKADGSTEVTINYTAPYHYLTFDVDGGYANGSFRMHRYKYGSNLSYILSGYKPTKEGYTFVEWSPKIEGNTAMPNHDLVLKAIWQKNETEETDSSEPEEKVLTEYGVQHAYQRLVVENAYCYEYENELEIKQGYVGDFTDAKPRDTEGFYAEDLTYYSFGQSKIIKNGSTTVTIYYGRKSSCLVFDTDGGTGIGSLTLKYEETIPEIQTPEKEGCVFAGWYPELPSKAPAKDTVYTAIWKEAGSEDTGYFDGVIY